MTRSLELNFSTSISTASHDADMYMYIVHDVIEKSTVPKNFFLRVKMKMKNC